MTKEMTLAEKKTLAKQQEMTSALRSPMVMKRFEEVLDKKASGFVGSLLAVVNNNKLLVDASVQTIVTAAMQAATLNLPINPNLGLAYIVPYKGEAQFQLGWKGFVQLAERTGQYKTINASVVYEGQIEDIDFITGEIVRGKKVSDEVIGYVAYIEMINGFHKTLYMTKDEMSKHAKEYSQSYKYDLAQGKKSSVWSTNFDAMALKTVLKRLISKYGIMSIDMQTSNLAQAMSADQAVIKEDGTFDYIDNKSDKDIKADEQTVESVPIEEAVKAVTSKPQTRASNSKQTAPASVPMPTDDDAPLF